MSHGEGCVRNGFRHRNQIPGNLRGRRWGHSIKQESDVRYFNNLKSSRPPRTLQKWAFCVMQTTDNSSSTHCVQGASSYLFFFQLDSLFYFSEKKSGIVYGAPTSPVNTSTNYFIEHTGQQWMETNWKHHQTITRICQTLFHSEVRFVRKPRMWRPMMYIYFFYYSPSFSV